MFEGGISSGQQSKTIFFDFAASLVLLHEFFHLRQVHHAVVFPAPYPEGAPCVVALPLKKLVALPIFNTDDLTPWEHILSQAPGISG